MTNAIRILYVDDEPSLQEAIKLYLEIEGEFAVDTLTSASEALEQLKTEHYDAIIADYQMSGMDGIEFLKKVRTSGNTIPFILFTGKGREEVVITALNEGADFYLQKGGKPEALFAELAHKIQQAVLHRRADVRIRDHERREADIINFLPDATFAIDTNGVVIAWNHAMEEMCGIKAAEILGKGNYEYSIPLYKERRPILVDLILHDEPSIAAKYPSLKKDGQTLIAEATSPDLYNGRGATIWLIAAPLYNNRGEVVGAIESIRDITERKQQELALLKNAEELHASYEEITATEEELRANLDQMTRQELELQESREKYRSLFTDSRDGIVMVDEQGRFLDANEVYCAMLGYSVEELRTISFPSITPEKWQAWEGEEIWNRRLIRDGYTGIYEKEYVRKDGIIFPVELQAFTVFDTNRTIKYVWGTVRDITERKQQELALLKNAEELHASYEEITATEEELRANLDQMTRQELELQESKRELSDIIEFLSDATFVIDREGVVIAWNRAIEEMTGISKVEMIGKGDYACTIPFYGDRRKHLLDLIDLEDEELQAKYQHVTRKGNTLYAETFTPALFRGQGAYVWATGSPLFDLQGKRIGAIESIRDITDHKRAEGALTENRRQLESMAANIPGVVFRYYVNPDGTTGFDYISGRSREILGLENDKATFEERFTQGVVLKNRNRLISSIQHAVTTKTLWAFESPYIKPSGEKIWVSAVSSPIMEQDRLIFDGAFFDITERKRAEEELLKNAEELHASYEEITATEEELRANLDQMTRQELELRESKRELTDIIEFLPDATFVLDRQGIVIAWNHAIEEMTGIRKEEMIGKGEHAYTIPFYGDQRKHLLDLIDLKDKELPTKYRHVTRKGNTLYAETFAPALFGGKGAYVWVTGSPLFDLQKNRIGAIESIRDITDRKRAEEALLKKNEELNAANEQLAAAEEELKGQLDALTESERLIRESEGHVRKKLDSLLSPDGDIGTLNLSDIIDIRAIQSLMEDFYAIMNIASAVIDLNGNVLVANGWQDICTKFHRVNPETCANCVESDNLLSVGIAPGTFRIYRCKNNMWDIATPITVSGKHMGNLFLGQFLFDDESLDYELFRSQAVRYGFDEQSYLAALDRVPRWNRETVDTVMAFYAKFALMISTLSHSNITLVRTVTERDTTLNSLQRVNQKLNVLSQLTRQDLTTQIFVLNSYLEMAKKLAKGQDGIIKNIASGERVVRSIKEITEFTKDYQNMGEKLPKWQNVKLAVLFGLSHISIGDIRHSLETENLEIFADPLLEKAFQGLLENTVAHGGHVSAIRMWHTETPDWATIVFEDNGIGIPHEKKERIFLRGEGARASVRGLFFVQEILSITGIIIRENGEPGKGARFEMTVPKGAWRMTGKID